VLVKTAWSLRNAVDFALRDFFRLSLAPKPIAPSREDAEAAREVSEFLKLFPWPEAQSPKSLRVVDIGCRTFFLAPALDALFRERGFLPTVHGVEVDAFRRLSDFRTRKEWGDFFAASIGNGEFHAQDFLKWHKPVDAALLLNPFVLERSVLAWGLPLSFLRPASMVGHCAKILSPGGRLLLGAPTSQELSMSVDLAEQNGFTPLHEACWVPSGRAVQTRPRFGVLLRARS
jgi:SAM-dependent methyltransferase